MLLYQDIVKALLEAGDACSIPKEKGYKQVADWHDVCAEYHTLARDAFHLCCLNSRPRSGPIYQLVKRAQFKSAVRKCKEVRGQKRSDRLAPKLLRADSETFWKEIKRINARNKPVNAAETVDGKSGTNDISAMWKDHFQKLLTQSQAQV